jgi:hypothetical protein
MNAPFEALGGLTYKLLPLIDSQHDFFFQLNRELSCAGAGCRYAVSNLVERSNSSSDPPTNYGDSVPNHVIVHLVDQKKKIIDLWSLKREISYGRWMEGEWKWKLKLVEGKSIPWEVTGDKCGPPIHKFCLPSHDFEALNLQRIVVSRNLVNLVGALLQKHPCIC